MLHVLFALLIQWLNVKCCLIKGSLVGLQRPFDQTAFVIQPMDILRQHYISYKCVCMYVCMISLTIVNIYVQYFIYIYIYIIP